MTTALVFAFDALAADPIDFDDDDDPDTPPIKVIADATGTAPLLINDDVIIVRNDGSFQVGLRQFVDEEALQDFIVSQLPAPAAGSSSGTATINVREGESRAATSSSNGVSGVSPGGNGSNGGVIPLLIVDIGLDGSAGGDGGSVAVNSDGNVTAAQAFTGRFGISALSRGGNGGDGGGFGGLIAVPGLGGEAGDGNAVTINLGSPSRVSTQNTGGIGVIARSQGGNGGSGGTSGGVVVVGRDGGRGGSSSTVSVENNGTIETTGDNAHAIYVESTGGIGGGGSSSGGLFTFAGQGGIASVGGTARVTNNGTVTTAGNNANGIFAQSVGGGGGTGGSTIGLVVAVGGEGGSSGNGGVVNVTQQASGLISTSGDNSRGIFAQSIGGGGGSGGFGGGLFSIGGSGAVASNGSTVSVTNQGQIVTAGRFATAIQAQSIGGGGGDGGIGGGAFFTIGGSGGGGGEAGLVTVAHSGRISTGQSDSHGILAQSVGGGGGNGGSAVSVSAFVGAAIGGAGGGGGNGGTVNVDLGQAGGGTRIDTEGARSNGVFAQSVGGGGGNGGGAVQVSVGLFGSLSVAVGGSGGSGGLGGAVNVGGNGAVDGNRNLVGHAAITTDADNANGILAQSVGGGGGNGGFAVSVAASAGLGASGAASIGIGGDAGGGGIGGATTVDAGGSIVTGGSFSTGVLAQSVGGGGGNGGFAVSGALAVSDGAAGTLAVGVGGKGGDGGNGGTVNGLYAGDITTQGLDADGHVVQSVGGGGGNGGFSVAGSLAAAGSASIGVSVGVGGSGGGGGNAGGVTARHVGDIATAGLLADGFIAQSVGGGGGNGGFNVSAALAGAGSAAVAVPVGVGGSGATGGAGNTVTANVEGNVNTRSDIARGVLVQSVGGGGGAGGFNVSGAIAGAGTAAGGIGLGIGGSGAGGGNGNNVTATVRGDVRTGDDADGGMLSDAILVQSLGGGGGAGGFNVTGLIAGAGTGAGTIGLGIGGAGGVGGDGRNVEATISGALDAGGNPSRGIISSQGDLSRGVVVQSVGGGGGAGSFNVTGSAAGAGTGAGTLGVGVGGYGSDGGNGGTVNAIITADVTTGNDSGLGLLSDAILVQSVGGGGGAGGFNVSGSLVGAGTGAGAVNVGVGGSGGEGGNGGSVNSAVTGDVATFGIDSRGVVTQSIGGGGGAGAFNVTGTIGGAGQGNGVASIGIGGSGVGGGNAGTVNSNYAGTLETSGNSSTAYLAQSVGGGGGAGGFNVSGAVSISQQASGAAAIGIGGMGGDGGNGGRVDARADGTITTSGSDAEAVLAQSVGGGGGSGAFNVSGSASLAGSSAAATLSVGVGGFGGDGGQSGPVTLIRNGDTITSGAGSDGITAQSIGGAGGAGGINIAGGLSLSSSGQSYSGAIGVGGFGGDGGTAGSVSATVTGNVATSGANLDLFTTDDGVLNQIRPDGANGILVQSLGGGGGNGNINVSAGIALATPSSNSASLTVGVGGFSGGAGNAGGVTLAANGTSITAYGDDKSAAIAQSIGGSGGNGAINVSGGISTGGALTVGVGGFAGDGGTAATVNSTVLADLSATGRNARGLLAQSVGGGGGNGGINISGGITPNPDADLPNVTFGLGGGGGAGNRASAVTVIQTGSATVSGVDSVGVLAQSVGGGGGSGGMNVTGVLSLAESAAIGIGIGGNAGEGANAGAVTVTSDGAITVDGRAPTLATLPADVEIDRSAIDANATLLGRGAGLVAQSIGGGGGEGGMNITGVVNARGQQTVNVGVGGTGGAGGSGSDVTVNRGTAGGSLVETFGAQSSGLRAQSIGGGGGNAGINIVAGASNLTGEDNALAAVIAIGGDGGAAGVSGDTTVSHVGDIRTDGLHSGALIAQSIGGGGGQAAINAFLTGNRNASQLVVSVGGGTGVGAESGDVSVTHQGAIETAGGASDAIFAQSVGGGGGNAALNTGLALAAESSLNISIGRTGGTGGDGGSVTVNAGGSLTTNGDESRGITAQSVGGGGGSSGAISISGSTSSEQPSGNTSRIVSLAIGLAGASGGVGGDVSATTTGNVTTLGRNAYGVLGQSIGGGGGAGGSAGTFNFNASSAAGLSVGGGGGGGGQGGAVEIGNDGIVDTTGETAHGVWAQSVGGGGGIGGYTYAAGVNVAGAANTGTNSLIMSVGGTGGIGDNGGAVLVNNDGTVTTRGTGANGVRAQSIGGGGGEGGAVISGFLNAASGDSKTAVILVGGGGGDGGNGSAVSVINEGLISTLGTRANGVTASSIGGGGGDAGLVIAAQIAARGSNENIGLTIGGQGGSGGLGGNVAVDNRPDATGNGGQIATAGSGSHGIQAQSIGGGGGNGSTIIAANIASGDDALSASMLLGGNGGSGNDAGTVTVSNAGTINTQGERAHGVFAQSIGGGGGNGGMNLSVNVAVGDDPDTQFLAIGGTGGAGGNGGDVSVVNTGAISTAGAGSHAIYGQSIGGGGGNAAIDISVVSEGDISSDVVESLIATAVSNSLSALIGSQDVGGGGSFGNVNIDQRGDLLVTGAGAEAVKVDAISGGGGSLRYDFDGITSLPGLSAITDLIPGSEMRIEAAAPIVVDDGGVATIEQIEANADGNLIAIALGGEGVANQAGQSVLTDTSGNFATEGVAGAGFGLVSTGGGGGTALAQFEFNSDDSFDDFFGIALDMGGSDATNNTSGSISSSHAGDVLTSGTLSPGVLAQSVSSGGRFAMTVDGRRESFGAARIRLGANSSDAQRGGAVVRTQTGNVVTTGVASTGVLLQSIGGGGGSSSIADIEETGNANADIEVALGASGGSDNAAATVSSLLNGDVTTSGDLAGGFVLQSIGGGGGEIRLVGIENLDIMLGGSDEAAGDGGRVDFVQTGNVTTLGRTAYGVLAQSIGGGGGLVLADADSSTIELSSANQGNGGAVTLQHTGNVRAPGSGSIGLFAQSIGGGGGVVGDRFRGTAGGNGAGGAVQVASVGNILVDGLNGIALLAQSTGTSGSDITVDVNGVIKGGSGDDAVAIALDGGNDNRLVVGVDGFVFALDDRVLSASDGNDTVSSLGILTGNIDLGDGDNRYVNEEGAVLRTLDTVDLGINGLLLNSGTLLAGGRIIDSSTPLDDDIDASRFVFEENRAQTTRINSSLEFTETSNFPLDVSFRAGDVVPGAEDEESDLLTVSAAATIDGIVTPTLLNFERAQPLVIIDSTTSSADAGATVIDTVVVDYSIGLDGVTGDGTSIDLIADPDFSLDEMNRNQRGVGDHINAILNDAGSASLGELFAFIGNQTDREVVIDTIDRLTAEGYAGTVVDAMLSARSFADAMSRCELPHDESRSINTSYEHCVWIKSSLRGYKRDSYPEFKSLESDSHQLSAGRRSRINDHWGYGFAGGIEQSDLRTGERFESRVNRAHLGASTQYRHGDVMLDAIASASLGYHDSERTIGIDGQIAEERRITIDKADSTHHIGQGNLRLIASLEEITDDARVRVRPSLDLDFNFLRLGADRERGADVGGLSLKTRGNFIMTATAAVEVNGRFKTGPITEFRPYLRGAISVSSEDDASVDAALIGAPRSAGTFSNYAGFDQRQGKLSLGFVATDTSNDISFRLGYDGMFGLRSTQYEAHASFIIEF